MLNPPTKPPAYPSPKVRNGDRAGVDGWLLFHAAYSRRFAEAALRTLDLSVPGNIVVDPFSGCGTTARAAKSLGMSSVCLDLNPALLALARGTVCSPASGTDTIRVLRTRRAPIRRTGSELTDLELEWMHPGTALELRFWRDALVAESDTGEGEAFATALFVRAARRIVRPAEGSNPTWPQPPLRRTKRDVRAILLEAAEGMHRDLASTWVHEDQSKRRFLLGDARRIPLADGCARGVLTSPPYLSRIDYVRATLPELLAAGVQSGDELEMLRREIMGGVLSRAACGEHPDLSGSGLAADVVDQIARHDSKASGTYYRNLAEQYFDDLGASMREILRILSDDGVAVIVVQTSYYKELRIPVPEIVAEFLQCGGRSVRIAHTIDVNHYIGRMSPNQRKHAPNKVLHESVVVVDPKSVKKCGEPRELLVGQGAAAE